MNDIEFVSQDTFAQTTDNIRSIKPSEIDYLVPSNKLKQEEMIKSLVQAEIH
jgi:hypothetical protein